MGRTNIEIDEELIRAAMHKYGLKTKREAVDFALRKLVGPKFTLDVLDSVSGIGWDGDLDEIRGTGAAKWETAGESTALP